MALQRRHLLALLVSAGAHLGLWFAVGSGAYRQTTSVLHADRAALAVYLVQPDRDAMTAPSPPDGQAAPAGARPQRPALAQRPPEPAPALPAPRYFPLNALTQAPRVASGLIGEGLLVIPGIGAHQATIQVWINERGEVDRVAIAESDLPEDTRQQVIAALAAVRFHPGKIGRITVSSQMQMDILLDSEVRL